MPVRTVIPISLGFRVATWRDWGWFLPPSLAPALRRGAVQHLTILPLAVLGAIVLLRRRIGGLPVIVAIAAASLPAILVVYAGPRYRSPVVPLLCLLAGFGQVEIGAWLRRRGTRGATG